MKPFVYLIPLLPLLAFGVIGLLRNMLREKGHYVALPAVLFSFLLSIATLTQVAASGPIDLPLYTWIGIEHSQIRIGFYIDRLTTVLLLLVTGVSSIIHLYSIRYMQGDPGYSRFFSHLGLFTFTMLMCVLANNLIMLFIFWEMAGFALYLLLVHHYERAAACRSAFKTFLVKHIADAFFLLGVILTFVTFGTVEYREVFRLAADQQGVVDLLAFFGLNGPDIKINTLIGLLLFAGAAGKSAQIPFHVWLPDTMEGPTPVSALMHAGMINAGGFMVARLNPLFAQSSFAMTLITSVGAVTALYGTAVMLTQSDIKRILGYSTMGQMGFMMLEVGVGAYSTALLHLVAHGIFKATLFLGAGGILNTIRSHSKEEAFSRLYRIDRTRWMTGMAAAAALPVALYLVLQKVFHFSLFRWEEGFILWFFAWTTAFLTAFYIFLLIGSANRKVPPSSFDALFRPAGGFSKSAVASLSVLLTLFIAIYLGSTHVGWNWFEHFLSTALHPTRLLKEEAVMSGSLLPPILLSAAIVGSGYYLASFFLETNEKRPSTGGSTFFRGLYVFLLNYGYVNEIYNALIVQPTLRVASWLNRFEGGRKRKVS